MAKPEKKVETPVAAPVAVAPVVAEVKRSRETKIDGEVVAVVRWTKKSEDEVNPVKCEWKISFADVTREELLEIAAAEMVIRVQSDYRKGKIGAVADVAVRGMLDRERAAFVATPESVLRQVGKLSAEDKKRLLKELGVK